MLIEAAPAGMSRTAPQPFSVLHDPVVKVDYRKLTSPCLYETRRSTPSRDIVYVLCGTM